MSEKPLAEQAQEWLLNEVRCGYQVRSEAGQAGEYAVSQVMDVCVDCLDERTEDSSIPITLGGECLRGWHSWQGSISTRTGPCLYSNNLFVVILFLVNESLVGWIGKRVSLAGAFTVTLCPPASEVIHSILSHNDNSVAFQESPATIPEENHIPEHQETVFSTTLTVELGAAGSSQTVLTIGHPDFPLVGFTSRPIPSTLFDPLFQSRQRFAVGRF